MRNKIITALLAVFLTLTALNLEPVFGRGIISVSKKNDVYGDSRPDLIYRTYTDPYSGTVTEYHNSVASSIVEDGSWNYVYNGKNYTSKWVKKPSAGVKKPYQYTYVVLGDSFHTKELSDYSITEGNELIGYNSMNTSNSLDQDMASIKTAYENSIVKYANPQPKSGVNYNSSTFYTLMNATGVESAINWTTNGPKTKIAYGTLKAGVQSEYRHAIISVNNTKNVYVSENLLYDGYFQEFLKAFKATNPTESKCYLSNIIISRTMHSSDGYEVARTSSEFYKQYNKGLNYWKATEYESDKGLRSVINLYDNTIILPQMSSRKVLVRHLNIGANKTVSKSIVANAQKMYFNNDPFKSNVASLLANSDTINAVLGKRVNETREEYAEYYGAIWANPVPMDAKITKKAEENTTTYKCIGYNIGISNSENGAKASISTAVNNGKMQKGTTVTVPAETNIFADDQIIIIDFYYSEYEKEVEVNHYYVNDKNSLLPTRSQTVIPNDYEYVGNSKLYRINSDIYTKEKYIKSLGKNITVRPADSLDPANKNNEIHNNNFFEYRGYKIYYKDGTTKRVESSNNKTRVDITSEIDKIDFYYYNPNIVEKPEPQKEIGGQVFVTAADQNKTTGACYDNNNYSINSIPSGTKAKVGVENIPKYMVGAIATDELTIEGKNSFRLQFRWAEKNVTFDYGSIVYSAKAHVVTDMAIYGLKTVTVYDAETNGTKGTSIFDWNNKQQSVMPTDMGLKIELSGINGKTIKNNNSSIKNLRNYAALEIVDGGGNVIGTVDPASPNQPIVVEKVFLSWEEMLEIDLDGNKTITRNDLKKAEEPLESAKKAESEAKSDYDNQNSRYERLKKIVENIDNIEKKVNELFIIKNTAEATLNTVNNDYKKLDESLQDNQSKLGVKNEELKVLNNELKTMEEVTLPGYYQAYILARDERNTLYAEAQCTDNSEECKEKIDKYNEHVENKVMETALKTYTDYRDIDIPNKKNEITLKENEIKDLETTIANLESTISEYTNEITGKIKLAEDAFNQAEKEYNEYKKTEEYVNAVEEYNNSEMKDVLKGNRQSYLKNVENDKNDAYNTWQISINTTKEEQNKFDNWKIKYDNAMNAYNQFKKYYDYKTTYKNQLEAEYMLAKNLGLKIRLKVQNMDIKINGQSIVNKSEKIKETKLVDNFTRVTIVQNGKLTNGWEVNKQGIKIPETNNDGLNISNEIYKKMGNYKEGSNNFVTEFDYNNSYLIDSSKENGIRALAGKVEYKASVVIGDKENPKEVQDNVYYKNESNNTKTVIFTLGKETLSRTYNVKNIDSTEAYAESRPVNIYTPITVSATLDSDHNQVVDQTANENSEKSMIQVNSPFRIVFGNEGTPNVYASLNNTKAYNKGYYIKFDFDVFDVKINGKRYKQGGRIAAGTWIGMITPNQKEGEDTYITAQAYGNQKEDSIDIISEEKGIYTVRAVAYNATEIMENRSVLYNTLEDMKAAIDMNNLVDNICNNSYYPVSYFAQEDYEVIIINRAYDFKVTDVKDISWKSVFRKTAGGNTNAHKGTLYYAGTTKWDRDSERNNNIISRTTTEIGRNPLRILPIGPYKNTDTTYIKAPKLGYRFSYDLKVTGSYYDNTGTARSDKKVDISTKFYYISKNGKEFIEEYNGTEEGIYLFYKTSDGKYVKIGSQDIDYKLRITPNDGYRYIEDENKSTLSTKSIELGDLRKLTLTHEMATISNNQSVITYYGEYKLPNSTIAVKVHKDAETGKDVYDINKPLNDGYIGVVFDIVAYSGTVDGNPVGLHYSQDTKEGKPNTSQWDYEGFLGYTKYGETVKDGTLSLKLEKGNWNITNDIYNAIKGTVMLYDIDQRAATDYE